MYPSDTLYGLGACAVDDTAVAKVYEIKARNKKKPLHALVSSVRMAETYSQVNDLAHTLLSESPAGKISIIVTKRPQCNSGILKDIETFGFRIPDDDFLVSLIDEFGMPITATSANKADEEPEMNVNGILKQLGAQAEYIDLVIDGGTLPKRAPSTVVDVSSEKAVIIREGAVPASNIRDV
jgi:L-threonylcarbamoyladenylate synthase